MNAETLIARTPNLQAPSPTVTRLLTLLNNPEADYDDITTTVGRDAVLSAKVLAVCNSAGYGLAQPVASIDQAVLYLGYGEIHRQVMALSFGGQIAAALPGYDMEAGALWRHSLVTALLAPRVLARAKVAGPDPSIAYTAGLVHDIGKLVIGQTLEAAARTEIRRRVEEDSIALREAERGVVGCDHAEIGATLLRSWRIPEIIVEAVADHHRPKTDGTGPLAAVVHVADAIAHQSGASPGWESFAVVRHEDAVSALGLAPAELELLALEAMDCLDQMTRQESAGAATPSTARAPAGLARTT